MQFAGCAVKFFPHTLYHFFTLLVLLLHYFLVPVLDLLMFSDCRFVDNCGMVLFLLLVCTSTNWMEQIYLWGIWNVMLIWLYYTVCYFKVSWLWNIICSFMYIMFSSSTTWAEVPRTPSSTRPGLELTTSRLWQYTSRHWDAFSNH